MTDEHDLKCARLQWLLDEAQVDTPEMFREECAKKQRLLDLLEKEASRKREFQRLAGSLTLPQWREQLEAIAAGAGFLVHRGNAESAADGG